MLYAIHVSEIELFTTCWYQLPTIIYTSTSCLISFYVTKLQFKVNFWVFSLVKVFINLDHMWLRIRSHDSEFDLMTAIGSSDWLWKGKHLLHGFNNVFFWNIEIKMLICEIFPVCFRQWAKHCMIYSQFVYRLTQFMKLQISWKFKSYIHEYNQ